MTSPTDRQPLVLREMDTAARCEQQGRLADAEAAYRRVVGLQPTFAPAYHRLGLLAYRCDRLELAEQLIASAVALDPAAAIYHRDRGEICRRLGRTLEAVAEAGAAVRLAADDPEAHYNLGLAQADADDHASAVASYRRAIDLAPSHGRALNNLGTALERLGDRAAAADAYRAAIALDPLHAEAQSNLGAALSEAGDIEGARACFDRALAVDPNSIETHFRSSALKRYRADDPAVAIVESLGQRAERLPAKERAKLYFTLGKMRDDLGQHERAFEAYARGNRLHRAQTGYDEARYERQTDELIRLFDAEFIRRRAGAGMRDATPVFIVGMPRSGSTLIEQIIASHPDAYGAGELKNLHEVVGAVSSGRGSFPKVLGELSADELRSIGQRYVASIRPLAPSVARITDKMPGNFNYGGLIHLVLPDAKIIHTRRDPMDTCLSCFTHLFNDTMEFAYDLRELGRYYVRYERLMRHWHEVLAPGSILDVQYEAVVDDVEAQTRRILDHIGLPWDDRCLAFYRTQRPVKTASVAQVRQPIYRTSVAGWKRFERQIEPLREIVGVGR